MKKQTKADKIRAYAGKNPFASFAEIAKATGTTYSYVYKVVRNGRVVTNVMEVRPGVLPKAVINKVISDGSTASYYQLPDDAKELQDLISHKDMNAQIGEIFRSCYRYGEVSHSDRLRDAKKIKYYAEAEIKRLEKLQ